MIITLPTHPLGKVIRKSASGVIIMLVSLPFFGWAHAVVIDSMRRSRGYWRRGSMSTV